MNRNQSQFQTVLATIVTLLFCFQSLGQSYAQGLLLPQRGLNQNEAISTLMEHVAQDLRELMAARGLALAQNPSEEVWLQIQKELLGKEEPPQGFYLDQAVIDLWAARQAYYQFDFMGCLHLLRQAKQWDETRPLEAPFFGALYEQRALLQGICHLALHEGEEAREAFGEAIRLKPHEFLNTKSYSPEVIRAYDEAKKQYEQKGSAQNAAISLTSMPPFADVYWNGEYIGQTPLTLKQMAVGRHYVEMRLKDYASWYRLINLAAGDLARLQANLVGTEEHKKKALNLGITSDKVAGSPEWLEYMAGMGEWLKVNELLLLSWEQKETRTQIHLNQFQVKEKSVRKSIVVDLPSDVRTSQGIAEKILSQWIPEVKLAANTPNLEMEPRELNLAPEHEGALFERQKEREPIAREVKQETWFQQHWIWLTVGVLLAGAAAGAALAMSQGGDSGAHAPVGFSANPVNGVVVSGNP